MLDAVFNAGKIAGQINAGRGIAMTDEQVEQVSEIFGYDIRRLKRGVLTDIGEEA